MPRHARQHAAGGWYHVFHRARPGEVLFETDQDRADFLRLLEDVIRRFPIEVHAFCLLGNHFHLLVRCGDDGLSGAMHRIAMLYTQGFNDRHGTVGARFRGRFGSEPIASNEALQAVFRYVTANAVKHGLTASARQHQWNSYRCYLGSSRWDWVQTDFILGQFNDKQEQLRSFVDSYEVSTTPSLERIWHCTSVARNSVELGPGLSTESEHRALRAVFLIVASDHLGYSVREIARSQRFGSEASLQSALRRARVRQFEDGELVSWCGRTLTNLGTVP